MGDGARTNPFLSFVTSERAITEADFRALRRSFPITLWDRRCASKLGVGRDAAMEAALDMRRAALERRNGELELWRSPEVYLWIARLLGSATKEAFAEALASIDYLFGIGPLPPPSRPILRGRGNVYRSTAAGWVSLQPSPLRTRGGQLLYYPAPEVFADLFAESKIEIGRPFDLAHNKPWADAFLDVASKLLEGYSPPLLSDFQDAVSTIILLASDAKFHSSNFGLRYYGSVFVSPYGHNECSGAAALIHEHLHLCSWLFWSHVEPEGRPPDSLIVQSPVSGNRTDAFSLCDAMMIYASNCDFYAWTVEESGAAAPLKAWAVDHYRSVARKIPDLYRMLVEIVPAGTRYRRFLDHAMQCFLGTLQRYPDLLQA